MVINSYITYYKQLQLSKIFWEDKKSIGHIFIKFNLKKVLKSFTEHKVINSKLS